MNVHGVRMAKWSWGGFRIAFPWVALLWCLGVPAPQAGAQDVSPPFLLTLESHRLIYVAQSWLLDHAGTKAGHDDQEVLLQFSFKKRIVANLYFAYTQKSFWQLHDQENSRPVRENDYNPEFFWDFPDAMGLDLLRIGLWEHESNGGQAAFDASGRPVNRSRTWNRTYVTLEKGLSPHFLALGAKLWVVTDQRRSEFGSFGKDNPDIQEYLGPGELYGHFGNDDLGATVLLRRGWRSGTETCRVDGWWSFNRISGGSGSTASLFLQAFSGYGDSLIEYNRKVQRLSVGAAFH